MSQKAGGQSVPTGMHFIIRDDIVSYTLSPSSTGVPAYYYVIDALDPTQNPPWIDWTAVDIFPNGRKFAFRQHGVYRLDGDILVIRLSRPGDPRPLKAVTEPSQGETDFILKRAKENEP